MNLEYLATVIDDGRRGCGVSRHARRHGLAHHMVNGLGVLGYGVGGIEAEAVLLGQPLYQPMPRIVGVRLHGELPRGSTATDLVLVVTEMLRAHGVVGAFVEFAGDGLAAVTLADRATISNMSPEFGATATLFPIDDETLAYLRLTGRSDTRVALVERYARTQGLWRVPGADPMFDELLELDLASVVPSVAGPRRPQDRVPLDACARTSGRTSRTAWRALRRARRRTARSRTPRISFPASDPTSLSPDDPHAAPARPRSACRTTPASTWRSRSRSGHVRRSAPARWRSRRSRRAPTRPTRP